MFLVSFQWKPPANYSGTVRVTASLVQDYQTYWTGLTSQSIVVENEEESHFVESNLLFSGNYSNGDESSKEHTDIPNLVISTLEPQKSTLAPKYYQREMKPNKYRTKPTKPSSPQYTTTSTSTSLPKYTDNSRDKESPKAVYTTVTPVVLYAQLNVTFADEDVTLPEIVDIKLLPDTNTSESNSLYSVAQTDRSPRNNGDNNEYQRLEATYGAWDKNNTNIYRYNMSIIIVIIYNIVYFCT